MSWADWVLAGVFLLICLAADRGGSVAAWRSGHRAPIVLAWSCILLFLGAAIVATEHSAETHADRLPPYRRSEWQHWTGDCLRNVRQRVLADESRRGVLIDGCRVVSGEWLDPYTGELVTAAAVVDVDHVVPLAFAHAHGGFAWNRAKRRAYANSLGDPDHLVAVTASANRRKGASGPDEWRPRREAWCWYGEAWDRIVREWGLMLHAAEWDAIAELRSACP